MEFTFQDFSLRDFTVGRSGHNYITGGAFAYCAWSVAFDYLMLEDNK